MEPNWKLLEARMGRGRCAGFIYMGRVNGIHLYKHGISRSYINSDDDGNCYMEVGSRCYPPAGFELEPAKLEECLKGYMPTSKRPMAQDCAKA